MTSNRPAGPSCNGLADSTRDRLTGQVRDDQAADR